MGIRVTVRNGNEKEWELTAWECEGMQLSVISSSHTKSLTSRRRWHSDARHSCNTTSPTFIYFILLEQSQAVAIRTELDSKATKAQTTAHKLRRKDN